EAYQENECTMKRYFSWYYASYALSFVVALTCLVYIQVNMEWALGFGAPILLMLFATLSIYLGTPFYVKLKPKSSLITAFFNSTFEIPAASFGIFVVISGILWIVLYDYLILLVASKLTGNPAYFITKERMGFGLVLSFLLVLVVAVLKGVRRSITVKNGHSDDPKGVIPMSTVWLLPQNCLTGFAEALNAIDQNEFYILEFPRSMSSIVASLIGLGFSSINTLCYIVFSRAYGPCKEKVMEEDP
ncbi:putative chaperone protein dnaJ 10-like, partial [Capsicum annuum]